MIGRDAIDSKHSDWSAAAAAAAGDDRTQTMMDLSSVTEHRRRRSSGVVSSAPLFREMRCLPSDWKGRTLRCYGNAVGLGRNRH